MDNIAINTSIDDNVMIITFDSGEEIKIETDGDVDLSEYVSKLTFFIDKKPKLSFIKQTFGDPKLNLIQETIENITASFNESIVDEDETIDKEFSFLD